MTLEVVTYSLTSSEGNYLTWITMETTEEKLAKPF